MISNAVNRAYVTPGKQCDSNIIKQLLNLYKPAARSIAVVGETPDFMTYTHTARASGWSYGDVVGETMILQLQL